MRVLIVMGPTTPSMGTLVASLTTALSEECDLKIIAEPTSAKRFKLKNVLPLWPIPPRRFHLLLSDFSRLHRARQAMREADVIHTHGRQAALLVLLLTLFLYPRPPMIVSLYEKPEERRDTWVRKLFFHWLGRRASHISGSTLSLTARIDAHSSTVTSASSVISPRVEKFSQTPLLNRKQRLENWSKLAHAERLKNHGQLVLAVGNIEEEKRYDLFVKAMQRVNYPATAVVIGDGDTRLLARLRSQGQDARVSFLGWRKNLEVWLQAASVLVVTSRYESMAFVAQEAMSLGVPLVASPVGRLRDLLLPDQDARSLSVNSTDSLRMKGVGSLLIDATDSEETARAITILLSNPGLWYQKQEDARARALSWPTMHDVTKSWLEIYVAAAQPSRSVHS